MESIIKKAFEVALEAHKKQKRKATDIPYIVHPMEVTIILMKNGANEELIAAGLLHDVVEDTDVTIEEIEKKFGKKIAFLVQSVTEPTKLNKKLKKEDEKKTWKERKKHTIDSIKSVSKEVKMLSCADKLANISSMLEDYAIIGENLWKKFNAPKEEQLWYYRSMLNSFGSGRNSIRDKQMYKDFKESVKILFPD